jgi:Ca2+-binding EF-hand superfamily protein
MDDDVAKQGPILVSCSGFGSTEDILNHARKILNAAKSRISATWEELFIECDNDKTGQLDYKEFRHLVRSTLQVGPRAICEYDLQSCFQELNQDGDYGIDPAELFRWILQGKRTPEELAMRSKHRLKRAKRAMLLACYDITTCEADVRQLFHSIDLNSSNRLSLMEFRRWVRRDLKLSRWNIAEDDLTELYLSLDKNSDGVDIHELWAYLRKKEAAKSSLGGENFHDLPGSPTFRRRKVKTFKDQLLESRTGAGVLRASVSLPQLSPSFTNVGRSRAPSFR